MPILLISLHQDLPFLKFGSWSFFASEVIHCRHAKVDQGNFQDVCLLLVKWEKYTLVDLSDYGAPHVFTPVARREGLSIETLGE
jgi:hypothetical protein